MLSPAQHARLARKCAIALTQAIDSLPGLLANSEPEAAASVVADLLKAVLTAQLPEPDPAAELRGIVELARKSAEDRVARRAADSDL